MSDRRAAIVGQFEWPTVRKWDEPMFMLEAYSRLANAALADAGMELSEVDGLLVGGVPESRMFGPSAVAEYLGVPANFAETVDLGGASGAGQLWRAVTAIEAGVCDTCVCMLATVPAPRDPDFDLGQAMRGAYIGADAWGAPHGQFDIPYGLVNPNAHFAMVAQRYMYEYDVKPESLAKIAVQERYNAQFNDKAVFQGQPISVEDVLNSPLIVDPLRMLEIVMPCQGGAAIVVTTEERAKQLPNRPVYLTGFGERVTHKSITYAPSLTQIPIKEAADRAFAMAGAQRDAMDVFSFYDCYTITVLLTIEDSGYCAKGDGGRFVDEHDMRWDSGDFPLNTHGGQLGAGQAGMAGGMSHITEALWQVQGRADQRQVPNCNTAYVTGTGGFMSEQAALILEGA
jgi:acetyl-CoA acetyltransferase